MLIKIQVRKYSDNMLITKTSGQEESPGIIPIRAAISFMVSCSTYFDDTLSTSFTSNITREEGTKIKKAKQMALQRLIKNALF